MSLDQPLASLDDARLKLENIELTEEQNDALWDEYDRLLKLFPDSHYLTPLPSFRRKTEEDIRAEASQFSHEDLNELFHKFITYASWC